MKAKICIVTGGNAGIGREIAIALARMNNEVVIVSRDRRKGEKAVEDIIRSSSNSSVQLVTGSLDSIRNVKILAEDLLKKFPRISVLINNAGVWPTEKIVNQDGLEYVISDN